MLDKNTYKPQFYLVSGVGASAILTLALSITYVLWQMGVEQRIITYNFSTSVLLTDALKVAGGAAPWALISVNWFTCKVAVKRWRSWVKKHFN